MTSPAKQEGQRRAFSREGTCKMMSERHGAVREKHGLLCAVWFRSKRKG